MRRRAVVALAPVAVAVAGWALLPRAAPSHPAPRHASRAIAIYRPADGLGAVAAGFGDAWMDDRASSRLLRVDGRDGRVLARIPVDGRLAVSAGAHGVWALQSGGGYGIGLRGPLLRIDPRTDRVVARIPLRTPRGRPVLGFGVLARGGSVWVWGPDAILRVDPRADRVTQRIAVGDARGELTGLELRGRRVVAATADGHLVRFDARTGARAGIAHVGLRPPAVRGASGRDVVLAAKGVVAAVDPLTGRAAWSRRLGFRIGAVVHAHGVLWVHSADINPPGDRVTGLDPGTGRVLTGGLLPGFGATGMAVLGDRVWIPTAGGAVMVARPFGPL